MLKTRGLADFRAEYNIWRKALAEELNLREGELERLELTGEVPETIWTIPRQTVSITVKPALTTWFKETETADGKVRR